MASFTGNQREFMLPKVTDRIVGNRFKKLISKCLFNQKPLEVYQLYDKELTWIAEWSVS